MITGPSGVGKSTLIKKLMAEFPGQFGFSVSHTTRDPRPGEQDGVDYHFVSREQMQRDIDAGLFVEHAEVRVEFLMTCQILGALLTHSCSFWQASLLTR